MPRVKKPGVPVQVYIPTDVHRELRVLAVRRGITLEALVVEVLRGYLAEEALSATGTR